jgi:hypothetical protein
MADADQHITVQVGDRVMFDSDDGVQAGYVTALRRHIGNGELHAVIAPDQQPDSLYAMPISRLSTLCLLRADQQPGKMRRVMTGTTASENDGQRAPDWHASRMIAPSISGAISLEVVKTIIETVID